MLPQKAYCYVSFIEKENAKTAQEVLNGYRMAPSEHRKQEVVLYLLFVSAGMCQPIILTEMSCLMYLF